jgi:hypothetical protein
MRRGVSGQQRARPARLDGCQVTGFEARGGVSHPIEPTIKGDECPARKPGSDFLRGDARPQEFLSGHDAM